MLPTRIYAKIDLAAIQKNVRSITEKSGCARVMAIVKADAYGHGAVEVSKALCKTGVKDFGVATAEEAFELRRNGIDESILVLGQVFPEDYPEIVKYGITVAAFDSALAEKLSKEAARQDKKALVYIKIDTGMGRIGVQADENGFETVKNIFGSENITVLGAFTHFANADCKDKSSAENQKKLFLILPTKLSKRAIPFLSVICTTAPPLWSFPATAVKWCGAEL